METIFTKIIRKEVPAHILYEDEICMVFLDKFPTTMGHSLVVPKRYAENFMQTDDEIIFHLMKVVKKVAPAIMQAVNTTGFHLITNNGSQAGQVIPHTHFHIIPRHSDDGLKMWGHELSQTEEDFVDLKNRVFSILSS